jgi:diketogulonate reductase-like aldo/keto reductase
MAERTIRFGEHSAVPLIGQGTWFMGENPALRAQEAAALRAGIDLGLTVIDTAEMYADGGAEEVVGEAIRGQRERVVLVSKVYPWNAGGRKIASACEESLRRLNTDYLDLYLLHWRGDYSLQETVAGMDALVAQGKFAAGAYQTSITMICRNSGRRTAANSARPIRCSTIWPPAVLNMTCCRGASSSGCR